jgi:hypothetical protein
MSIPTQIVGRLAALGVAAAEIEERFVRGAGPGGQKIKIFKSNPTVHIVANFFVGRRRRASLRRSISDSSAVLDPVGQKS